MPDPGVREVVIARLRAHSRALVVPTVWLLAVCAAYGFFGARFTQAWQSLTVLIVAAVFVVVGWLFPLVRWLARNYTITSRRVVVHSGIFVRERRELMHSRGYDVTVRRSWVQALLRSGDVVLSIGASTGVTLRDVPGAALVVETLHDLMEASGNRADTSIR